MADVPAELGICHSTVALASPAVAVTLSGALGVAGVQGADVGMDPLKSCQFQPGAFVLYVERYSHVTLLNVTRGR